MAGGHVTDDDLAELIELASEATSAFIGGDMQRSFALTDHADYFTLMSPTGGEVTLVADRSDEYVAEMARFFKSGDGRSQVRTGTHAELLIRRISRLSRRRAHAVRLRLVAGREHHATTHEDGSPLRLGSSRCSTDA